MAISTREYLLRLRDVILLERERAKELDVQGMYKAMEEKEEIIRVLSLVQHLDPEDKEIADEIRHENRRNAYLFKATLGWIRETMEFFGKRTVTSTYSQNGNSLPSHVNGRLLSGKV